MAVARQPRPANGKVGDQLDVPISVINLLNDVLSKAPGVDVLTHRISGWLEGLGFDPTLPHALQVTAARITLAPPPE